MSTLVRVILVLVVGAAFLFAFFVISWEVVHYTESTEFCSTCHSVMDPQSVSHAIDAHASVDCGTCHIARGALDVIWAKIGATRYVVTMPLQIYERPLPSARNRVPDVEDTCMHCHNGENFKEIKLEVKYQYGQDDENTLTRVIVPLKIGNGEDPVPGGGMGAHWHVQNSVSYYATDEDRQDIPWVQVEREGRVTTYIDSESDFDESTLDESEIVEMTCLDCHNRDNHEIRDPGDLVDESIANGDIPADLPSFKRVADEFLLQKYEDEEAARQAFEQTVDNYKTEYDRQIADRDAQVDSSFEQVWDIYTLTHFPLMNAYWDTYPDNSQHLDSPGCFRCHDGNHLSGVSGAVQAIPAECDTCHAIPQSIEGNVPLPAVNLALQAPKPESHREPLFLSAHRFQYDVTCASCHTVADAGGTSDQSFCSNAICHGQAWEYLDLNAPAVLALVAPDLAPEGGEGGGPGVVPHPIYPDTDCTRCHNINGVVPFPENHVQFSNNECTSCHEPLLVLGATAMPAPTRTQGPTGTPVPTATPTSELSPTPAAEGTETPEAEATGTATAQAGGGTDAVAIPHAVAGRENCVACHQVGTGELAMPASHEGRNNDSCIACHEPTT
jgi:hypothetical protein